MGRKPADLAGLGVSSGAYVTCDLLSPHVDLPQSPFSPLRPCGSTRSLQCAMPASGQGEVENDPLGSKQSAATIGTMTASLKGETTPLLHLQAEPPSRVNIHALTERDNT